MKASKPLKDLPGFDKALELLMAHKGTCALACFDDLGSVVLPGLKRVGSWDTLWQLALCIGGEKWEMSRRHLRAVPPAPPVAANDCEAP